jgi:hypothetical protein
MNKRVSAVFVLLVGLAMFVGGLPWDGLAMLRK